MPLGRRKFLCMKSTIITAALAGCSTPFSGNEETKNGRQTQINQLEPHGEPVEIQEEREGPCGIYASNVINSILGEQFSDREFNNLSVRARKPEIRITVRKNNNGEIIEEPEPDAAEIQEAIPTEISVKCDGSMRTFEVKINQIIVFEDV